MTITSKPDVIDELTGIRAVDASDAERGHRAQARRHAQRSYLALFEPAAADSDGDAPFTVAERFAVAAFVARLHGQAGIAEFYRSEGAQRGASTQRLEAVIAEAAALAHGGARSLGVAGPGGGTRQSRRALFGAHLAAALAHAHLIVLHPRDAKAEHLQALLDADWSADDIVTLSQLVGFVAFQIRVVVGLRNLAVRPPSRIAA